MNRGKQWRQGRGFRIPVTPPVTVKKGGLLKALYRYNYLRRVGKKKLASWEQTAYFRNGIEDRWYLRPEVCYFLAIEYDIRYPFLLAAIRALEAHVPVHILKIVENSLPFIAVGQDMHNMVTQDFANLILRIEVEYYKGD